jgi:hypothetical protein
LFVVIPEQTAIDKEGTASDVTGLIRGKISHKRSDILRLTQTT